MNMFSNVTVKGQSRSRALIGAAYFGVVPVSNELSKEREHRVLYLQLKSFVLQKGYLGLGRSAYHSQFGLKSWKGDAGAAGDRHRDGRREGLEGASEVAGRGGARIPDRTILHLSDKTGETSALEGELRTAGCCTAERGSMYVPHRDNVSATIPVLSTWGGAGVF